MIQNRLNKQRLIIFVLLYFFTFLLAFSKSDKDNSFSFVVVTEFNLSYKGENCLYNFGMPAYTKAGFLYTGKDAECFVSLKYTDGLNLGETYIMGGSGYSYMKIGYFVEEWGEGYAIRPTGILSKREDFFPDNVFYSRIYKPNPIFNITMGNDKIYEQVVISNLDEEINSINDSLIGLRTVWVQSEYYFSLGLIRKIGYPPPCYFLTMEKSDNKQKTWIELNWEYHSAGKDIWSFVVGVNKSLASSKISFEYIIDKSNSFLFSEETLNLTPVINATIRGFLHIASFSFAFNTFFNTKLNKYVLFEPGVFLFLGKKDEYFSNLKEGNNNSIYLKLIYSF